MDSDKLCYEVEIPSDGVYRVITSTNRKSYGRQPTHCNSDDRERSLSNCEKEYGVPCVCEDLENDFWLIVSGCYYFYLWWFSLLAYCHFFGYIFYVGIDTVDRYRTMCHDPTFTCWFYPSAVSR